MDSIGQGMITGGWEYVWTAYGMTWAVLCAYTAFLLMKTFRGNTGAAPQ